MAGGFSCWEGWGHRRVGKGILDCKGSKLRVTFFFPAPNFVYALGRRAEGNSRLARAFPAD